MTLHFVSKSAATAFGLFTMVQAFASPVSQKQAAVKPGSYSILKCSQPLFQPDPETGIQTQVQDIEGNPVLTDVVLNINIAANGKKTLDGSFSFAGYTPQTGDYNHSSRVEIKKLPVSKILLQKNGSMGFDFVTNGNAMVYVEGDRYQEPATLVSLNLENGADTGSLLVTAGKKYDVVDFFVLDFNCLPAANQTLLRSLAK